LSIDLIKFDVLFHNFSYLIIQVINHFSVFGRVLLYRHKHYSYRVHQRHHQVLSCFSASCVGVDGLCFSFASCRSLCCVAKHRCTLASFLIKELTDKRSLNNKRSVMAVGNKATLGKFDINISQNLVKFKLNYLFIWYSRLHCTNGRLQTIICYFLVFQQQIEITSAWFQVKSYRNKSQEKKSQKNSHSKKAEK